MSRSLFLKILVGICRFGLVVLFLFAVIAKLYYINDPTHSFLKNMPSLVGEKYALPVAVAVIVAESLAVIFLLIPKTVRYGAALAAMLLLTFAAYAIFYKYGLGNSEGLECGCFGGIIASQLGLTTALRNLALLLPCLIVIFCYGRKRDTGLRVNLNNLY